jgi:hypothetical protein
VSYVYLHAGTPLGRKGDMELALPRMDMPIGLVEWEVFVPDRYAVKVTDGNVIERRTVVHSIDAQADGSTVGSGIEAGAGAGNARGVTAGIAGGLSTGVGGGTPGDRSAPPPPPPAPAALEETLTVAAVRPNAERPTKSLDAQRPEPPSQNVVNLQRRAAGVLPVRVDVPRAGSSHQFVKPLVVDQVPSVTFRYKRR